MKTKDSPLKPCVPPHAMSPTTLLIAPQQISAQLTILPAHKQSTYAELIIPVVQMKPWMFVRI